MSSTEQILPQPVPHPVLALGAHLKNTACAAAGTSVRWSALHGDLGDSAACLALQDSAEALLEALAERGVRPAAVAHDLHPDFHSTRLARSLAACLGVPAIALQHHHAHLALVVAEQGLREPVLGWALDGVGLGSDGSAWGGELLWLDAPQRSTAWQRVAHLRPLALPGGDRAAREPWRMAAAVLHARGRGAEIVPRLAAAAGAVAAATVERMLERGLNCPPTSAAGRWFDAAAAALGVHRGAQAEAEAAIALEAEATQWLAGHPQYALRSGAGPASDLAASSPAAPSFGRDGAAARPALLDLSALVADLFDWPPERRGEGAARFHLALSDALAGAAIRAAGAFDVGTVVLGGGCFFNRLLSQRVEAALERAGLRVLRPGAVGCGDAGLALGQAWLASWTLAHHGQAEAEPVAMALQE